MRKNEWEGSRREVLSALAGALFERVFAAQSLLRKGKDERIIFLPWIHLLEG